MSTAGPTAGPRLELHPHRLIDVGLAAVVLAYGVVELPFADPGTSARDSLLAVLLSVVPVLLSSRWPAGAAVGSAVALALSPWVAPDVGESLAPFLGPVLTSYSAGRRAAVRPLLLVALADVLGPLAAGLAPSGSAPSDLVVLGGAALVSLGVGRASREMQLETDVLRDEAAELARRRDADVRAAAEHERLRIARELHDVLGHTVSVMSIQAGAVRRRLLPEQVQEREALEAVESAGREAVAELRRLLGLLREDPDGPVATGGLGSAARLRVVVEDVRRAGLSVSLEGAEAVDGLPPALAMTVVRVVQEGLTNVLRHAPGATARVTVAVADGQVDVEVVDDGSGTTGPGDVGFGLVGMRERVAVFGGRLTAGAAPGGGFALHASLPRLP